QALLAAQEPGSGVLLARSTLFDINLDTISTPEVLRSPAGAAPPPSATLLGPHPAAAMPLAEAPLAPGLGGKSGQAAVVRAAPAGREILPGLQLQECVQRGACGELWRARGSRGARWVRFVTAEDVPGGEATIARALALSHTILAELESQPAGPGRL